MRAGECRTGGRSTWFVLRETIGTHTSTQLEPQEIRLLWIGSSDLPARFSFRPRNSPAILLLVSAARAEIPSEFSLRVLANLSRLQGAAEMSNSALIAASGLSKNYFYTRLRGEGSFNIEDIAGLARALDVDPGELTSVPLGESDRSIRVDGKELARRLRLLNAGETFPPILLLTRIGSLSEGAAEDTWIDLMAGVSDLRSERLLHELAAYFDIPVKYLFEPASAELVDQVEAEIELRDALRQTGAEAVAGRALGEATPAALRAIARAIKSIKK
ncbi:hypothetical protein BH10ACT7_BH10ACT7_20820 [soil metagenome]